MASEIIHRRKRTSQHSITSLRSDRIVVASLTGIREEKANVGVVPELARNLLAIRRAVAGSRRGNTVSDSDELLIRSRLKRKFQDQRKNGEDLRRCV